MPARRIAAALATAVSLTLAGCGTAPPTAAGPAPVTSAATAVFNAADVTFLQQLLPHHQQGVEIAQIGAAKATRSELKIMAGAIVTTQQDEQTRMAGWLAAWQQPGVAASRGPLTTPAKISALGAASAAKLDDDLMTLLIAHQQAAIKMAKAEAAAGRNPETVAFAKQVEQSRAAEIKQMQTWLTSGK